MKTNKQFYLGIDVSKPWFDASLMVVEDHQKLPVQTERFNNDKPGIKAFEKWLNKCKVSFDSQSLLVIENTGIYHRLLWLFCSKKNLPIHIGNAAHIKWSFGIARGKNDKIDSIRLCQYAYKEADTLKATPALNPALLQLKDLMSCRTKLINQKNSIKVHLKELKSINDTDIQKMIEKAHKDVLAGLDASIKLLEAQIKKIIEANTEIKANYELLKTVPGIGHLTAIYLIGCTNNFICKITGKQLACYAGVVPFEHSSGISIKGKNRVHKMANKDLKKMLHLSALTAKQYYPEFKQYYDRKKAEGKHTMCVLNAIRNKIVLRIAAVINNQQPYVENPAFESQIFRKKYLVKS
jgi:transposase